MTVSSQVPRTDVPFTLESDEIELLGSPEQPNQADTDAFLRIITDIVRGALAAKSDSTVASSSL
jgi:hypothetical protein